MRKFSQVYFLFPRILISICTILILSLLVPLNSKAAVSQNNSLSLSSQNIIASHQYDFARPLEMNSKVNNEGEGQLEISLQFPEEFPIVSMRDKADRTQKVQFAPNAEYQLSSKPNQASVPFYTINIIVPKDAKRFRISDIKAKEAQKTIDQPLTIEKNKSENRSSRKSKGQPSSPKIKILKTSQFRDVTFLRIQVFPIDYDSSTQVITQSQAMQFDLNFQTHSRDNSITIKDPENNIFHKIYQSKFLNYQWKEDDALIKGRSLSQQGEYHILSADDLQNSEYGDENAFWPDYLVVRSQTFINSPSFNTWLNYRISQQGGNHTIAVASLEDIYAAYSGTDNPQRIKDCISFIYENWGQSTNTADLIYLMLLGDADFGSDTEPWFIPAWDSNNSITGITGDNKYGCLEGDDGIPELLIGRLPVKDETKLSVVLEKTINFETTIPQGENHFGTRNLFLGGSDTNTFGPTSNGARNILIDHYQESDEFIATESYNPNYPNFSFENFDPIITDLINNKGYLIISYNGDDGEETGWMPENIDTDSLQNSDRIPSLVISASSRTARFDWPEGDSSGERWIKKDNGGSIAFFGPSRRTYGMSYSADESILTGIYQNNITILGAAALEAKLDPSFSEDDDYHRYNFLGDPAINIQNYLDLSTKPEINFSLNAETSTHPLNGDNVTLKSSIRNIGHGPAEGLNVDLSYIAYSGDVTLVGSAQITPPLNGGESTTFTNNWMYEERFWDQFKFSTNEIDELSEFNNISVQSPYYIKYPMHFNPNNTTGVENGSYEHPFTKFKYTGPNYYLFGFDYIINHSLPGCVAKVYIYPGAYEGETSNCFNISNMEIKGEGDIRDIVILKDSFNVSGYTSFENLTFQQVDTAVSYAPITIDGETSSVQRCIFKDNLRAIACQNTWGWMDDRETIANISNNIFLENNTAIYVADNKITTNFINNVAINNTEFLNISLGDDISNNVLIKNSIIRDNTINDLFPFYAEITNNYNNTDISYLFQTGSNNLDVNPEFIDLINQDFFLQDTSPCINAGDPDPIFNDLDGTINDMGAYGGPNAYAPLKITSPNDGDTLFFLQGGPVTFDITWQTSGIDPDDLLKIRIYTINSASPDSGGGKNFQKKSSKPSRAQNNQRKRNVNNKEELQVAYEPSITIYLNETTLNTGSFTVQLDVLERGFYFLKIYNVENPSISDRISFEIENNRYRQIKTIESNYIY